MTKISIFRSTFMWVETVPAILDGRVPATAPFSFLGQYGRYAERFDLCQSGKGGAVRLPWDTPRDNFFWRYYFEGKHAGEMTGAQAWKKFVPVRCDIACKTLTAGATVKVGFEAYYFPHGVAVVARATCRDAPQSPRDIAKLALAIRFDYRFALDGSSGPAGGLTLDQVAERCLRQIRDGGLDRADGFPGDNQPFSVTTFLVGEDAGAFTAGSQEHLLLETVTGWNRTLKARDLKKLALGDRQLVIRNADNDNMMYAQKDARAIWLPRWFAGSPDTPALACYHHNVVQASLQTLSLGEFVSWAASEFSLGHPVAPAVAERAKRAAALLQLLQDGQTALGKKVTYRTASVVDQIARAGWGKAMTYLKELA